MLQLYITSTPDVGFYFLYDPVKEDIYEGSFINHDSPYKQSDLQVNALESALIHLANTKVVSRHAQPRTDILIHAPVKIYIQHPQVRNQFTAPWKYEGLWKTIAQKRRQLKYFDIQKDYHTKSLPPSIQAVFESHLRNIQRYRDDQYDERWEDACMEAIEPY